MPKYIFDNSSFVFHLFCFCGDFEVLPDHKGITYIHFYNFITFSYRVKELGAENPELKSSGNDAEDENNDLAILCTSNVSLLPFFFSLSLFQMTFCYLNSI